MKQKGPYVDTTQWNVSCHGAVVLVCILHLKIIKIPS